jgi:hypothetical protein
MPQARRPNPRAGTTHRRRRLSRRCRLGRRCGRRRCLTLSRLSQPARRCNGHDSQSRQRLAPIRSCAPAAATARTSRALVYWLGCFGRSALGAAAAPGVSTPLFHAKNAQHVGKSQSKRPHNMWKRPLTRRGGPCRRRRCFPLPRLGVLRASTATAPRWARQLPTRRLPTKRH